MIEEKLIELCDLVGLTAYPAIAPETAAQPFAVYTRVATERLTHLSGPDGLVFTTFQIDVYGDDYIEIANKGDVLRLALNGYSDEAAGIEYVSLEDEADLTADADADGLFRRMYEYRVTHTESTT